MRITVDSKEFSAARQAAERYSGSSASPITQCALLTVDEHGLSIRTTVFTENCTIVVNQLGDEREDGEAVVMVKDLPRIDNGRVTLRTTKARLILEYQQAKVQVNLRGENKSSFPVWPATEQIIAVPSSILSAAASVTSKVEKSGRPITAAVHFIQHGELVAIIASDSIVSYMATVPGNIGRRIALNGAMLSKALTMFGDCMVGICTNANGASQVAELRSPTMPGVVYFSEMETPDPSSWPSQMFGLETAGSMAVSSGVISTILDWCRYATGVSEDAQILLSGGLTAKITGTGVDVDELTFEAEGQMEPPMAFFCKYFAASFSGMRPTDKVVIRPLKDENTLSKFIYMDGKDGDRHILPRCQGGFFEMP